MPNYNYIYCIEEKPWNGKDPGLGKVIHADAVETDSNSDYYIEYKCPHCLCVWRSETPD